MPQFTLAICARNAQDIIGDCLESIRHQTVPPDEVIVAVDEMSDPTVAVAEKFGARVIASNATGLYEARNAVLHACTTDYLAFTDADCVLVPKWVELAKNVLSTKEEVAAGTGRHPPVGVRNLASWLHHMWYIVETEDTGVTHGIIGGNSYFRTQALRDVGGWLNLPRHSAAEDMYIAHALQQAGHTIWFEEGVAAQHNYETRLKGLWKKGVMMGKDIVVMMRATNRRDTLWSYTLAIPLVLLAVLAGIITIPFAPLPGLIIAGIPLAASFIFFWTKFGSFFTTIPRWIARWILIVPYSWGILKGLVAAIPQEAIEHQKNLK
jgi:glycosyltransferase involved in cell wall biosynthesis